MDFKFIGIFSWGGLISHFEFYNDLDEGIEKMNKRCHDNHFDPDKDDARIFKIDGTFYSEVYSFDYEEIQEKLR